MSARRGRLPSTPIPSRRGVVGAGLAAAVVVAVALGPMASSHPDGLERVAADHGLDQAAGAHPLDGSPVADYRVAGVGDERTGAAAAGALGVGVTFAAGVTLTVVTRRVAGRRRRPNRVPPAA